MDDNKDLTEEPKTQEATQPVLPQQEEYIPNQPLTPKEDLADSMGPIHEAPVADKDGVTKRIGENYAG